MPGSRWTWSTCGTAGSRAWATRAVTAARLRGGCECNGWEAGLSGGLVGPWRGALKGTFISEGSGARDGLGFIKEHRLQPGV